MPEPTLGELTNIKPEASLNPVAILDSRATVQQVNQSAQFNAEMKQRRYAESLGALKDLYQDIGKVQAMEVMEQDRPMLTQKTAELFKEIGSNPEALFGSRGGAKYAEIQKSLGELRTLATQSKQDNIGYTFHRKYLESDPDLQTPENMALVDGFAKKPLGQRGDIPIIQMPPSFDVTKAASNVKKMVGSKYSDTGVTEDNKFVVTQSGIEYNRDAYLKNWNIAYDSNPKVQKWAENLFNRVKDNPSEFGAYADPDTGKPAENPRELYNNAGKWEWNGGQGGNIRDEQPEKRVANPFELLNQRQANAIALEGLKTNDKIKIASVQNHLRYQGVPANTSFLIKQYANIMQPTGRTKTVDVDGKGTYQKEDIIDVDKDILKKWAGDEKESVKKGSPFGGVTEIIQSGTMPDLTTRTKEGNIRVAFFKRYKEGDKLPNGRPAPAGEYVKDATGNNILDGVPKVIPIRSLLGTLGGPFIEKKILATTIETAADYLKGKSLEDIDKINRDETGQPESKKPVSSTGKYHLGSKTFTQAQVEKAAKASGLSVDEYIQQVGLK